VQVTLIPKAQCIARGSPVTAQYLFRRPRVGLDEQSQVVRGLMHVQPQGVEKRASGHGASPCLLGPADRFIGTAKTLILPRQAPSRAASSTGC
jgi:hypothetical protein